MSAASDAAAVIVALQAQRIAKHKITLVPQARKSQQKTKLDHKQDHTNTK